MRVLLDTCAFLWLITEDKDRLSLIASDTFLHKNNQIYFSLVSAWEISIKKSTGKLVLSDPVYEFISEQIESNQLILLPIELDHIAKVSELPFYHKDPFDRLIIAQAITEDIAVLTSDSLFNNYGVRTIW
ncbi:type II toxin-antitoxin system VapC family toxin [Desulfococcaceae bacterium HSG7]|nr:type II toxin-antitoxin system VapC family toxin [Desulfococcaceae bacterium HSG7]